MLFQKSIRSFILEKGQEIWHGVELICSATDQQHCESNGSQLSSTLLMLQNATIEETDVRIMLHTAHALKENQTNVLILSSDTDIVVLALYYYHNYQKCIIINIIIFKLLVGGLKVIMFIIIPSKQETLK